MTRVRADGTTARNPDAAHSMRTRMNAWTRMHAWVSHKANFERYCRRYTSNMTGRAWAEGSKPVIVCAFISTGCTMHMLAS